MPQLDLEFYVRFNSPDETDPERHYIRAACYNLTDALAIARRWHESHYPYPQGVLFGKKLAYYDARRQHNIYIEWILHEGSPFEHRSYWWGNEWHTEVPEWVYRDEKWDKGRG